MDRYPVETLDPEDDDGTMPDNVETLAEHVVGHRIVKAEMRDRIEYQHPEFSWEETGDGLVLTLDNGTEVALVNTSDCCAYTEIRQFLLHPDKVEHVVMGVGTTDGYTTWHIYCDYGDIMELTVGWSCGNPFYYGYGFDIVVLPIEQVTA